MQRARCYLIGETAEVLKLQAPVMLASQKRIWRTGAASGGYAECG